MAHFDAVYAQAWQLANQLDEGLLLRRLKADKALVDLIKGNYAPALEAAQTLYAEARERGDWWAVWDSLQLLLMVGAVLGLEPALEATVRSAMLEAEGIEARRDLALLRLDLGMALLSENRLSEAQTELETALEEFRRIGERAMLGHGLFFLGFIHLEQGNLAQAEQLIGESVAIWKDRKEYRHQARSLAGLALVLLCQGQRKAAQKTSAEAYELRADWARGLYDLPLVLYARAQALGKEGRETLQAAQTLLQQVSQSLPTELGQRLLGNRFVVWVLGGPS